MAKNAKQLFEELDRVTRALHKELPMDEPFGKPKMDEDEGKDKFPFMGEKQGDSRDDREPDQDEDDEKFRKQSNDEGDNGEVEGGDEGSQERGDLESTFKSFTRSMKQLTKALTGYQMQSSGSKKDIAGGNLNTFQDNFSEQGVNDTEVEGIKNYDQADKGYGGPNMPPQLMHPKEYEAIYNRIVSDAKKGPSNPVTTVDNSAAYDSAKSFGSNEVVDVTDFMKSFDGRINQLGGAMVGLTKMVDKITEAQIANTRALSGIMKSTGGRKSTSSLNKSQTEAPKQPQFTRNSVLPVLEKGVADGELSPIELTKFEMGGGLTETLQGFLAQKGVR